MDTKRKDLLKRGRVIPRFDGQRLQICMYVKRSDLGQGSILNGQKASPLKKKGIIINLIPVTVSK
jgi:hypothetical protein